MRNKKIKKQAQATNLSSPEELDAYIRISKPGVWIGLLAVVALLIGAFVWGFVGRLEVQVKSVSYVKEGGSELLTTYINSRDFKNVQTNQTIRLDNGKEIPLEHLDLKPVEIRIDEDTVPLEVRSKGNWSYGEIVYIATSDNTVTKIGSGAYSSIVITGSMTPMSFVFNF